MSGLYPSHLPVCLSSFLSSSLSIHQCKMLRKLVIASWKEFSPSILTRYSQEFLGSVCCSQIDHNGGIFSPAVRLQSHKDFPHSLLKTALSTFSPALNTKPRSVTFSYLVYRRKTAVRLLRDISIWIYSSIFS